MPGCHTQHEEHQFGPVGKHCTGPPATEDNHNSSQSSDADNEHPKSAATNTTASPGSQDSVLAAISNLALQLDKLATDQQRINTEVQQMKNTPQGATACIQPSQTPQSSMTEDPSLPGKDISHQPTKLEQSILRGEYVNFIDLLKPHKEHVAHGEDAVVVDQEGNLTLQTSRSRCAIDSFSTWLSAWSEYERIIVLANPHRYGEMAKYRCVIHQASRKFIWSAVYAYDFRFRQESARVGGRRFDILDHSLYTTTLDATALRKDAKQCFRSKSFNHETRECPFHPASALETPAQKKSPSNPQGTYRPAQPWKLEKWFHVNCEGCNLFQRHACNPGTGCKRAHVCKACRGHHALADCTQSA